MTRMVVVVVVVVGNDGGHAELLPRRARDGKSLSGGGGIARPCPAAGLQAAATVSLGDVRLARVSL